MQRKIGRDTFCSYVHLYLIDLPSLNNVMIGRLLLLTLDCFQERPECYSLPLGQLANLLSLLYWIREIAYTLEGLLPCKSSLLLMPYPFHLGCQSIPTLALALFPRTTESPADDFLDSLE